MNPMRAKAGAVTQHEGNYFEQGLRLMEASEFEPALAMFNSAIKLGLGNLAKIYVCRGEALAYLGRWQEAERSLNEALRLRPDRATAYSAHNERGNVHRFQEAYDKAIADYTMAIQLEPDYHEAYYNRALAYEGKHHFAEAEADLTQMLQLNPNIGQAYEVRGRVRASQRKFDAAIADLSHYLEIGAGHQYDNHSEIQGYLLTLRLQRVLWRFVFPWRR